MSESILVIGASGKLGRAVVRQLHASGYVTHCATRNPRRACDQQANCRCVRFDWTSPLTWLPALQEVSRVFLTARPLDITAAALLPDFLEECREAQIEHVVFSSALGTDVQPAGPLGLVESFLRHGDQTWTILRPNFFMENFSEGWLAPDIRALGRIAVPADAGRTSFVSVDDVAAVAAAVFADPQYRGRVLDITGDDPRSHTAVAAALTRASGRPVNYEPISEDEMRARGRRAGLPPGPLEYLLTLYKLVREGHAARTTNVVKDVLGRPPRGFEDFARDNADAWRVVAAAQS
jgi:uncharacterized protein YbjT (DUF2867 family)